MTDLTATKIFSKRQDLIILAFILLAVAIIYAPVFYTEYLYTDEAPQLWFSNNGIHQTWIQQGRWITYLLFKFVFGSITTVRGLTYARLFSLAGWMISLPVWYFVLKDIFLKNSLSPLLAIVSMVYIISMPSFSIYIGWASCLEMFLACTAGLIAGYVLYSNLQVTENSIHIPIVAGIIVLIAGIISLFTYQNGFGCFFIPFFIQFVTTKKLSKHIIVGIASALAIYALYYLLFKWSIHLNGMAASSRTSLVSNPANKFGFFIAKPLATSFHFTLLFNEKAIAGKIFYVIVVIFLLMANFIRQKASLLQEKIVYAAIVLFFLLLVYLPSLLVAENYGSNRTLFALNFVVFILLGETIFSLVKNNRNLSIISVVLSIFFLVNAAYNFRAAFVYPVTAEYNSIKNVIAQKYTVGIDSIYFIRPAEDAFEKKYHVAASWDEFGLPSTAKPWTPESMIKQMLFEKTGNRQLAEKLLVKSGDSYASFIQFGDTLTKNILFIDAEKLIAEQP